MTFSKQLAATLALALSSAVHATDLTVMNGLVGFHPLMDLNHNSAGGVLEIVASETEGVGFRYGDRREILSPAKDTTLYTQGNVVIQEFQSDDLHFSAEYTRADDEANVAVLATLCPKDGFCELIELNRVNDIGNAVEPASFFSSVQGTYRIELVGGEAPHDGNDTADISAGSGEANLVFPYCPNAGGLCDPGYIDLSYGSTKVYKKVVSSTNVIYTIQSGGKKYTWEQRGGKVYFRNYQYKTASGRVITLTHVLRKV